MQFETKQVSRQAGSIPRWVFAKRKRASSGAQQNSDAGDEAKEAREEPVSKRMRVPSKQVDPTLQFLSNTFPDMAIGCHVLTHPVTKKRCRPQILARGLKSCSSCFVVVEVEGFYRTKRTPEDELRRMNEIADTIRSASSPKCAKHGEEKETKEDKEQGNSAVRVVFLRIDLSSKSYRQAESERLECLARRVAWHLQQQANAESTGERSLIEYLFFEPNADVVQHVRKSHPFVHRGEGESDLFVIA